MIIPGRFLGSAPYFLSDLRSAHFNGLVWLLADTGASRTTLLDGDARLLRVPFERLEPAPSLLIGVGGSVEAFIARNTEIALPSDEGDIVFNHDLWIIRHDVGRLMPQEAARVVAFPSILGRDLINRYRFTCDYRSRQVQLES